MRAGLISVASAVLAFISFRLRRGPVPLAVLCLVACISACLSACLSASISPLLSGGLPLLSVDPAELGERTVEQRLAIDWPEAQKSIDAVLEIGSGKLELIGLAPGVRLFSLDYDGRTVVETRHLPSLLPGERIVNDLLLIGAPLEALRRALPEDWTVEEHAVDGVMNEKAVKNAAENGNEEKSAAVRRRSISHDGETAIVIDYFSASPWQGRVRFENRPLHYQLTLDSHEL